MPNRKPIRILPFALCCVAATALIVGGVSFALGAWTAHGKSRTSTAQEEALNESNYAAALRKLYEGDFDTSSAWFAGLGDYREAPLHAAMSTAAYLREVDLSSIASVYGGPDVHFGRLASGGPATWIVLGKQDGKALLLLHTVVDACDESGPPLGLVFSQYDEQYIADPEVEFPFGLPHGKMFLLSQEEVERYLPHPQRRGVGSYPTAVGNNWALRAAEEGGELAMVIGYGPISVYHPGVIAGSPTFLPVRPAMWININS